MQLAGSSSGDYVGVPPGASAANPYAALFAPQAPNSSSAVSGGLASASPTGLDRSVSPQPSGFEAWAASVRGDVGQMLLSRQASLTPGETEQLIRNAPSRGDIGPSMGLAPLTQIQAESDQLVSGSTTALFAATAKLEGEATTGAPGEMQDKLNRFSSEVAGIAGGIGDSMTSLATEMDDLNRVVIAVTDLASKTNDPAVLAKLPAVLDKLQARVEKIEDEIEKRAAMRAFLLQMLGGNPSRATMDKLRALGLGTWMEEIARQMIKFMRKCGGVSAGLIHQMQAAGLSGLVEIDAKSLAIDRVRGRENAAQQAADQLRDRLGTNPATAATARSVAAGQAVVGAGQLSQTTGDGRPVATGTAPVGVGGPVTGGGDPNQKHSFG